MDEATSCVCDVARSCIVSSASFISSTMRGSASLLWILPLLPCLCEGFAPSVVARRHGVKKEQLWASAPGKVDDVHQWLRYSSDSLQRFHGTTLLEELEVDNWDQVDQHERFAVLSHGTQDDPIYCYFNQAALATFQWPESEIYAIPSRYSAPDGEHRQVRQAQVADSVVEDFKVLPEVVRQRKDGTTFSISNIYLWNVYDEDNQRVGQTALYDRNNISY